MTEIEYKWPPLESDPNIFNKYFNEAGLPEFIGFEELISFDSEEINTQYTDFPIFGIIAAISRPKGRYFIPDNLINHDSIPFYMKQTRELDQACGLVAALNLFGNNLEILDLPIDCLLKNFYDKACITNPEERAKLLEENNEFKTKHQIFAHQGQSNLPTEESSSSSEDEKKVTKDPILHHFVSFIYNDGNLIELDGTLPSPIIIKKEIDGGKLMIETVEELKKRIELGVIGENISVLFLTYH